MADRPGFEPARVWVTEEMGNETLIVISAGDRKITARAPSDVRVDFDAPVWFRFREDKLHRFDGATGQRI
jgi:ABC-type sugar transport system ATPase subunit